MGITRATVAIAVWLVLLVASIAIAAFLIFKQRIRGNVTALLTICGRLFIAAFVSAIIGIRQTQIETMKPEFERMIEIFLQAVEKKSPPEREKFLVEACWSDESLHQSHHRREKVLSVKQ